VNPRILDILLLVNSPIIFLLLEMCKMIAIKTGAVMPYKMEVYINALTGEMPI
jgi:hypothetical protein